jgi:hypothetical protein
MPFGLQLRLISCRLQVIFQFEFLKFACFSGLAGFFRIGSYFSKIQQKLYVYLKL